MAIGLWAEMFNLEILSSSDFLLVSCNLWKDVQPFSWKAWWEIKPWINPEEQQEQ